MLVGLVLQERNERAENLKLEGNKLFAAGDMDAAIVSFVLCLISLVQVFGTRLRM